MIFPWARNIFAGQVKYQEQFYSNLSDGMQDLIKSHRKDIDEDNPRDFIDCFLKEMSNRKEEKTFTTLEDQDEKLRTILIDIFIVRFL
jgi:hypothetical protein